MEHSPQRSHRVLGLRYRHRPNQPRLHRRPQRHRLADHVRAAKLVHGLHRLHIRQTRARRAPSPGALLARQVGHGGQRHRTLLSLCILHLRVLSHGPTRHGDDHELEHCHVWRHHALRDGVLYDYRPQAVQTSCRHPEPETVSWAASAHWFALSAEVHKPTLPFCGDRSCMYGRLNA